MTVPTLKGLQLHAEIYNYLDCTSTWLALKTNIAEGGEVELSYIYFIQLKRSV